MVLVSMNRILGLPLRTTGVLLPASADTADGEVAAEAFAPPSALFGLPRSPSPAVRSITNPGFLAPSTFEFLAAAFGAVIEVGCADNERVGPAGRGCGLDVAADVPGGPGPAGARVGAGGREVMSCVELFA